jgi:glucokinase
MTTGVFDSKTPVEVGDKGCMILVFDLGGTHVSASTVGRGVSKLDAVCTRHLSAEGSAKELLALIVDAGREALNGEAVEGISMAAPGPFDYAKGVSQMRHKHLGLFGVSIREALADAFHVDAARVLFLNDAHAFLLGEIAAGGFAKISRVVGITLGTGIGSAFFAGGNIVSDGCGVPEGGELYNVAWEDGIVEDSISTKAIRESFLAASGEDMSVKEIAEHAATDVTARSVLQEFGRTMGSVLDIVLQEFQPEHLVLGGAITRSVDLFLPEFQRELRHIQPKIHVSQLLERAALSGAADRWYAVFPV